MQCQFSGEIADKKSLDCFLGNSSLGGDFKQRDKFLPSHSSLQTLLDDDFPKSNLIMQICILQSLITDMLIRNWSILENTYWKTLQSSLWNMAKYHDISNDKHWINCWKANKHFSNYLSIYDLSAWWQLYNQSGRCDHLESLDVPHERVGPLERGLFLVVLHAVLQAAVLQAAGLNAIAEISFGAVIPLGIGTDLIVAHCIGSTFSIRFSKLNCWKKWFSFGLLSCQSQCTTYGVMACLHHCCL